MAQEIPVIDMWAPLVPTREIMAHVADNFPQAQLGYLRIFQKREPDLDAYRAIAPKLAREDAQILAELDAANVSRALVTGFDEASTAGKTFVTNDCVAALAGRHPTRFIPFAGIDIMRGSHALRELEHWVRERGFRGLSLRPFMIGLPAEDRHYYPFYEKCVELEIPLSIHASANWTTSRPSDLGHPRHFDVVACDLPELKLILSHAGYPWVLEACLLAWKHPNVYLELAAHRPKYFLTPGADGNRYCNTARPPFRTRSSTVPVRFCSAAARPSCSANLTRCRSRRRSRKSGFGRTPPRCSVSVPRK